LILIDNDDWSRVNGNLGKRKIGASAFQGKSDMS